MNDHRGAAFAVAGAIVVFLSILGALIVVLGWIGLSIYALVKAIGSAPDSGNPAVVVLFFAILVTTFTVLLAAMLALAGRALTPRKRKRGGTEQLALDLEP